MGFRRAPQGCGTLRQTQEVKAKMTSPALYYHSHHQHYTEDLLFWTELAEQNGEPILELGCGTGRVLRHLHAQGFQATGIDNDPSMLKLIGKESPANLRHAIAQADMLHLPFRNTFALIILPCNTYTTFRQNEREVLLREVQNSLLPQGIFAFSILNPHIMNDTPDFEQAEEDMFIHPTTGHPVIVSAQWENAETACRLSWHYDHLLPNGIVHRTSLSVKHYKISTDGLLRELERNGFNVLHTYGDFDHSPYSTDSPYLIPVVNYLT